MPAAALVAIPVESAELLVVDCHQQASEHIQSHDDLERGHTKSHQGSAELSLVVAQPAVLGLEQLLKLPLAAAMPVRTEDLLSLVAAQPAVLGLEQLPELSQLLAADCPATDSHPGFEGLLAAPLPQAKQEAEPGSSARQGSC